MPFDLNFNLADINIYGATVIGYLLYEGFDYYLDRRQVAFLRKNKMPSTISVIKDLWDVKEEEVKKNNQYSIEKM